MRLRDASAPRLLAERGRRGRLVRGQQSMQQGVYAAIRIVGQQKLGRKRVVKAMSLTRHAMRPALNHAYVII